MPLIYLQRRQISPGGAYVALANHAMASMMSIEGDVFGSCVEGVNVSVFGMNINISFAAGGNS